METVQGGVPPYGVKETLVVNGNNTSTHQGNNRDKLQTSFSVSCSLLCLSRDMMCHTIHQHIEIIESNGDKIRTSLSVSCSRLCLSRDMMHTVSYNSFISLCFSLQLLLGVGLLSISSATASFRNLTTGS